MQRQIQIFNLHSLKTQGKFQASLSATHLRTKYRPHSRRQLLPRTKYQRKLLEFQSNVAKRRFKSFTDLNLARHHVTTVSKKLMPSTINSRTMCPCHHWVELQKPVHLHWNPPRSINNHSLYSTQSSLLANLMRLSKWSFSRCKNMLHQSSKESSKNVTWPKKF